MMLAPFSRVFYQIIAHALAKITPAAIQAAYTLIADDALGGETLRNKM